MNDSGDKLSTEARTQEPTHVIMDGDPVTPLGALREIKAWLDHKLTDGPKETKGHQDRTGHPHYWTAVLIPDWDIRQKLDLVNDALKVTDEIANG